MWPSAQASAANQVLTNNSGTLTWASNPGNFFVQGGNAFGATAILGTTDNNPLTVITDNTLALTISNVNQAATFTGSLTALNSLALNGTVGGTFTQAASANTASYSVTWPAAQAAVANTVLTNNGAGNLTWASNPANAWLVGGNTLSSGAQILGVVSGTSTLTIDSAGAAALTFGAARLGDLRWICDCHRGVGHHRRRYWYYGRLSCSE